MTGQVQDMGQNREGEDPGFLDFENQVFELSPHSLCINGGIDPAAEAAEHPVLEMYVSHQQKSVRTTLKQVDIGAFEFSGDK